MNIEDLRQRAEAGDGWAFGLAPEAAYDLTIVETDNGVCVMGFATPYPSLEIWEYSDDIVVPLDPSGRACTSTAIPKGYRYVRFQHVYPDGSRRTLSLGSGMNDRAARFGFSVTTPK